MAAFNSGSMPDIPEEPEKNIDLDYVLENELGQFGRLQKLSLILIWISLLAPPFMFEFIFGTAPIPHRCRIPECEVEQKLTKNFNAPWVLNAIPTEPSDQGFASCLRYPPLSNTTLDSSGSEESCPANLFNRTEAVACDSFVYARRDTVVYDFNLACQEKARTLAGTMNSFGTLLVLPLTGYVSDRWGRRMALVVSIVNLAIFGLWRAFSVNYPMYLTLQLLQTTFGAGTFSTAYIFGTELVGPKWRVLNSAIITSMFTVGEVILGAAAWSISDWRMLLIVLHVPCFLIITYFWILPENVRWLLAKRRYVEAKDLLEKMSRINKRPISAKSMRALMTPTPTPAFVSIKNTDSLVKSIFKSRILLRRVLTTPIWWMTTTFIFYGLSVSSIDIFDHFHLNYIVHSSIQIPGFFSSMLLLDRVGRKASLSFGFGLSAACNISLAFIPRAIISTRLVLFLVGKFCMAFVFASLYLYTVELYPTQHRHSLLGFSSMIGRLGAITAPLSPALTQFWSGFPSLLFGSLALLAAALVLTQPETSGARIPDTLAEAEALGRS